MTEYDYILYMLCAPEIFCVLSLLFRDARQWIVKLVEDSDGDPHHTDGLFIIVLYVALWCFRVAIIAGLQSIYFDKQLIDVAGAFMGAGGTLLGVRIMRNKILPEKK